MKSQEWRAGLCARGCAGTLHPVRNDIDAPDFWVRPTAKGRWIASGLAPVLPDERPGRIAYRCNGCKSIYRIVDQFGKAG